MQKKILWLCLTVVGIVPFSNDIFVSALPQIRAAFATTHSGLILSVFLAGLALAQPIYGPLSDHYGRKPILIIGLLIFLIGSAMAAFSNNFTLLISGRFIQAIGACSTIISALAIVRDTQSHTKLVSMIGTLMAVIGVCPAVAPLVGSYLTQYIGWRGSFYFLFLLGLLYLFIIAVFLKETSQKHKITSIRHIAHNYKTLFNNRSYLAFCIISAMSYGILFTFFSLASIYLINMYQVSVINFGWLILINGGIIFMASIFVPRISNRYSLKTSLTLGTAIITLGAITMLLANYFFKPSLMNFFVPMLIVTLGIGFIRPSAAAGAMTQAEKKISGTAAAGFNLFSFVGGSICSAASAWMHQPINFAAFATIVGAIAFRVAIKNKQ